MINNFNDLIYKTQPAMQVIAFILIIALTLASVASCALAFLGVVPWFGVAATFGEQAVPQAGMIAQLLFTGLMLALCFFLPASTRVLRLETSHRDFSVTMDDVARAYALCHRADREGAFTLEAEFDSVRERMKHLRDHPDLGRLEPEVLELAAKMSHEARDLADAYSDEKVARARRFLQQRQEEIADYKDQITTVSHTCDQLKRWSAEIDAEERLVKKQLKRLKADLTDVLPALGYALEKVERNVVPMSAKPAK